MNKILSTSIVVLLIVIIGLQLKGSGSVKFGGAIDYTAINKMAASTAVSVTTSDTLVQATTTRQYAVIVNDGAYPVYLALNGDVAAVANAGIRLNPQGGSYEISQTSNNLYSGAIRAIAVGGTSVVTITSY